MSIQLDHAHVSRATDKLAARAAEMAARRAQIEASVESLMTGWRGEAAARFAAFWEEWRDSADAVIDGLSTGVDGVRYADSQLSIADTGSGDAHTRMRGRLG
ncbi:WXG100 family type VII secretion target [Nocardioides sp. 616]|uniref:WXG100 family type VII secretion target n=1 Tax=Nocardioides sp. 616 TaxID=2268090 RepID=UPI000CE3BD5C|nr:WXG100 family type VII secretion target [Nocardioides sp. 616]